jgi:hypothetical protein
MEVRIDFSEIHNRNFCRVSFWVRFVGDAMCVAMRSCIGRICMFDKVRIAFHPEVYPAYLAHESCAGLFYKGSHSLLLNVS